MADGCVHLDDNGFIKTGPDLNQENPTEGHWPLTRPPDALETTTNPLFASMNALTLGGRKRLVGRLRSWLVPRTLGR